MVIFRGEEKLMSTIADLTAAVQALTAEVEKVLNAVPAFNASAAPGLSAEDQNGIDSAVARVHAAAQQLSQLTPAAAPPPPPPTQAAPQLAVVEEPPAP